MTNELELTQSQIEALIQTIDFNIVVTEGDFPDYTDVDNMQYLLDRATIYQKLVAMNKGEE